MKNESKKPILDDFLSKYEMIRIGQMFGHPAYYVGRSMVACLYEGKIGLKVPENAANEARAKDAPLREWIQFDFESEDLRPYKDLIDAAIRYAETEERRNNGFSQ